MTSFEEIKKLDYELTLKIASLLSVDSSVRKFFQIATISGTFIFWGIILTIWYAVSPNSRDEVNSMLGVSLIMLLPVFGIKQSIRRNRPDFKDDRFGSVAFDVYSFPSGHATRSAYVMILMPIYTPTFAIFWIFWGLLMITSRLILGVHYISDIIGGIILSSVCLGIMYLMGWLPIIPWTIIS